MSETGGRRLARRVQRRLHERVREAGRGAAGWIEEEIDRHQGWLRDRRRAGTIELGLLFDTLDALGESKQRFFRLALDEGEDDPVARQLGEPPPIVTLVRARLTAARQGEPCTPEELAELDRLRYSEPRRALALAEAAAPRTPRALLPRLLGVAASTYRLLIELDRGEHTIAVAMELARERDDRSALGDLYQRLAYLVADRGDHAEGLRLAERATVEHVRCCDLPRVGQSLVDQGMMLFYLDRLREANKVQEAALRYLSDSAKKSRFSALQILGLIHQRLGEPRTALAYAVRAEELLCELEIGPWPEGKLRWMLAALNTDLGILAEAEQQLARVIEIFRSLHLGETALGTTDLVRVQLLRGKTVEAYETAQSMLPLLEPLRHNRIVSAVIADLLRGGATGLTLARVDKVKTTLEAARKRSDWRFLANAER